MISLKRLNKWLKSTRRKAGNVKLLPWKSNIDKIYDKYSNNLKHLKIRVEPQKEMSLLLLVFEGCFF